MKFLSPWAFAFAATLPVVVAFYLLRRKRVVRIVPSTLLWQQFLAETQASAPFQKLRHHWLLLFQLLLLCLVILALARPYFAGQLAPGAVQIVILDSSASMQSTDEKPSRFEKARTEALKLVDALDSSKGGKMVLLTAGASAEVRQSATGDKSALRRALKLARPTDSVTRLTEALRLAEGLANDKAKSEIHLFSDGAFDGLDEFGTRNLPLIFHRVGLRGANAGISTLDVKAHPEDPSRRAIFASVINPQSVPATGTLELYFDDQMLESRPLQLDPTNTTPVVFMAQQDHDGVFTVKLRLDDDLAADNEARVVSPLPRPLHVLLVTKGNRFLEKALTSASPLLQLETSKDYTSTEVNYDFVVIDDVIPKEWPGGNVLAIHTGPTHWFPSGLSSITAPTVVDWRQSHPLMRFVSFENTPIAESYATRTPSWATSLLDSSQASLMMAGDFGRQRVLWIGFDTLQSQWPRRVSFPIFIANAVDWLNPATARSERFLIHCGDPLRLPIEDNTQTATIRTPSGTEETLTIDSKARELIYSKTGQQGVYRVQWGTNLTLFAANLLDSRESDTRPSEFVSVGKKGNLEATPLRVANLENWRHFALAGLVVMLGEWWWFHRRTA